jgi:hypothetical protein
MAGRIRQQLSRPNVAGVDWGRAVNELISRLRTLENHWNRSQAATRCRWHAASACEDSQILAEALRIEEALARLRYQPPPAQIQSTPPALGTIIAELRQLGDEFDDVEIDLKQGLIGVTTAPIVLEDINLGPFSIELHVSRLADRLDSECFQCIAVEPNPAASNDSTVHPHVQDGHLCAGEAVVPITNALKEGRIADAFILVRSVLLNYNPDSPYVSLENWSGRECGDCGRVANSDSMCFCDGCEKDVCEDCYSSCDMCDQGCCHNCLEADNVSGNRCCSACRHTCAECDRTVDEDSFDHETDLCPGCLAKQQTNQEQENNHEPESEPVNPTAATDAAGTATPTTPAPAVPEAA